MYWFSNKKKTTVQPSKTILGPIAIERIKSIFYFCPSLLFGILTWSISPQRNGTYMFLAYGAERWMEKEIQRIE